MIILSKILQILIKFTPFAIVIFNFLYKNFHFCSKIKFFGHLEVWDLLNINSNYPSSVMCPTLCPLLCPVGHIFLKVGHFLGTFYVGEPLIFGNSKTLVLESYSWSMDFEPKPWKFTEISCLVEIFYTVFKISVHRLIALSRGHYRSYFVPLVKFFLEFISK